MFREIIERMKEAKRRKRAEKELKEKEELKNESISHFLDWSSFANLENDFERDACKFAVLGEDIFTKTVKDSVCESEYSVYRTENDVLVRRAEFRKDNEVISRQYAYLDKNFRLHLIVEYLDTADIGAMLVVVDYMVDGGGHRLQKFDLQNLDGLTKEQFELYKRTANFKSGAEACYKLCGKKDGLTV